MENISKADFKKTRVEEAVRRQKRKVFFGITTIFIVIVGVIWLVVYFSKQRLANVPGESYLEVGREHISLSDVPPKSYNSNPPSSGAHFSSPAEWGVYDYEVNDKIFIHNLEHGGVWISYRPSISQEAVSQLKEIVKEFGGSKIVMAPRSANDADIAMAAWRHVFKFNLKGSVLSDTEKDALRTFYRAFKNRGPELVPDTMPGIDPKSVQ